MHLTRLGLPASPAARGVQSALALRGGVAVSPVSLEHFFTSAVTCVNYASGAILLAGCVLALVNAALYQVAGGAQYDSVAHGGACPDRS